MRTNPGRRIQVDDEIEDAARPVRRHKGEDANVAEARATWEPIVCPACDADHPTTAGIRLKRAGAGIEARCSECGSVAARYIAGVWSS